MARADRTPRPGLDVDPAAAAPVDAGLAAEQALVDEVDGRQATQADVPAGDGTIRNAQTGLCLDVDRNLTANGTKVLLWTCSGAANQRWTRRS